MKHLAFRNALAWIGENFIPSACVSQCPLLEFQDSFGNETFFGTLIGRTGTERFRKGLKRVVCVFPKSQRAKKCFRVNLVSVMVLSGIRFEGTGPQDCGELRHALSASKTVNSEGTSDIDR